MHLSYSFIVDAWHSGTAKFDFQTKIGGWQSFAHIFSCAPYVRAVKHSEFGNIFDSLYEFCECRAKRKKKKTKFFFSLWTKHQTACMKIPHPLMWWWCVAQNVKDSKVKTVFAKQSMPVNIRQRVITGKKKKREVRHFRIEKRRKSKRTA